MMRAFAILLLILGGLLATEDASAQYYSWGVDPSSYRWRQMRSDDYRVIYPDTASDIASRMMCYLDAVNDDIDYGYRYRQMSIPFVVHPANFHSNGLVMWMPRRVEFLSTPEIDGYSMPWLKQLIAHEYRHAVQYNNLNRGIVKGLSYVIGQQSSTIGLLFMPLWMMEGDAVMSETEMSTFGRGLQPSFTMTYRAYGDVVGSFKNRDKWFCGSYRDYIPSHYALGYLLCRYGYGRYGAVLGDDVAELSTRRPYMVVSTTWVLRKLYGTSQPELFENTFNQLHEHWMGMEEVDESTVAIDVPEVDCYTRYSHPVSLGDGRIIVLKEDLDKPSAFMVVDVESGQEQRVTYTGMVSTRPILGRGGRLWWTEYRRSALFEQRVKSQLCYMDLDVGHPRHVRGADNVLYPTPTSGHGIAWVEYTPDGRYTIVVNGASELDRRTALPYGSEIHGMAWDDATEGLYVIVTDDRGMHIARVCRDSLEQVTQPAYTTLSNLRAAEGRLYFGSIASGRDELHCYDISSASEYRLSTSRYGSFEPAPIDSGRVAAVSYDVRGYMPVTQSLDDAERVEYAPHPTLQLLPEVPRWDVVNLDTLHYDANDVERVAEVESSRRFRRLAHAFNIHSWAPASYDPYAIVEESSIAFNLGATLMSQNLLSTVEGFATWGWNQREGSVFRGTLRYYGLGVNLWLSGVYGGNQQIYKVAIYDPDTESLVYPMDPECGRYYSITAGASLPLLLQRGYHTSQLNISASWNFSNGMVANVDEIRIEGGKVTNIATIGYTEGVHLLNMGIGFSDQVRMAHRDFLPPWGVTLTANYALNPTTDDFGHLMVLYGKLYTPGFGPHHSLSAAVSYQTSIGGFHSDMVVSSLTFKSTRLIPRGYSSYDIANGHYLATALNYQLPVWYPDGGWPGVIFFKRLRLNLGADYASFRKAQGFDSTGSIVERRKHIGSYGADLGVDFNLFTMPEAATISVTFSLYKKVLYEPFEWGKWHFGFGVGLPF